MKSLVTDALWERLQSLLPPPPPRRFRFPGRKPLDYRKILTGILFVLKTGMAWDDLPAELGCGCGKTCRHYLQLWHQAGVWRQLHAVLLAELNEADQIDWERALIDASFAKAPEGGEDTGPNPTDRGKSGSKHHVLTDAQGIPLDGHGDGSQRQRGHADIPSTHRHACRWRQTWSEAAESEPPARRPRLRFRTGAADVALVGDHADPARAFLGGGWLGQAPLVRGANHFVAPFVRSITASLGPAYRNPRSLLTFGLLPYMSELLGTINHFFRTVEAATTSGEPTQPSSATQKWWSSSPRVSS